LMGKKSGIALTPANELTRRSFPWIILLKREIWTVHPPDASPPVDRQKSECASTNHARPDASSPRDPLIFSFPSPDNAATPVGTKPCQSVASVCIACVVWVC
jgi:hypothetical protein